MPSNPLPRVLCVDDDEDSRLMLITLLRSALIEVKAVGTAAQALSSIQTERFDLYLLDAWLPDLDGFELCRRMRVRCYEGATAAWRFGRYLQEEFFAQGRSLATLEVTPWLAVTGALTRIVRPLWFNSV